MFTFKRIIAHLKLVRTRKAFCISVLVLLSLSSAGGLLAQDDPNAYDVAQSMFTVTDGIETMTYELNRLERFNGSIMNETNTIKLHQNPFKLYFKQSEPKKDMEILFVTGERDEEALIRVKMILIWWKITRSPYGSDMRKDQHHTIFDLGYGHVMDIMQYLFTKYGEQVKSMIKNKGTILWDGHSCWEIEFNSPDFSYIPYTVKEGETLLTIAKNFKISEYMILEINDEVDDYDDVSVGMVIQIPSVYAKKMILYVDKTRHIPLYMEIHDEKGLYEQYEYKNVKLNPQFAPDEFTRNYFEYKF